MIMDIKQGGQVNQDRGCAQWPLSNPTLHVRVRDLTVSMFLIVQDTNAKILGSFQEGVYFWELMGVNNTPLTGLEYVASYFRDGPIDTGL